MTTRFPKDHRGNGVSSPQNATYPLDAPLDEGSLRFWTRPPDGRRVLVDLTPFASGQDKAKQGKLRNGAFRGRERLIGQLAPAVRERLVIARKATVDEHYKSLRGWCRVFDRADQEAVGSPSHLGVEHLGALHLRMAIDDGLSRRSLAVFRDLASVTRQAMGLPPLQWRLPADVEPGRELLPEWQTQAVRVALKRGWYEACDRWELAERLLLDGPESAAEYDLHRILKVLQACSARTGLARPSVEQLKAEAIASGYPSRDFPVAQALRSIYPDAADIRMAFNSCLASSGWNPSTLLEFDASGKQLIVNARDANRYIMYSHKPRATWHEQMYEGLLKSQGSPGVIVLTLLRRTKPLRDQLVRELEAATTHYRALSEGGCGAAELAETYARVEHLREGVKSAWLYVAANHGIAWLRQANYPFINKEASFLATVIAGLNEKRRPEDQIGLMTATDFRLAYAEFALRASGGSVLFVQRALSHRSRKSTTTYLDNNLVNGWANQLWADVTEAIWLGVRDPSGLDTVVLALRARSGRGEVTDEERKRLEAYRRLKRSRLNIGCRDPTAPPRRIAPTFVRDGKRQCGVHRCLLCPEHARILPESLPGVAMRTEELLSIKSRMSTEAFLSSSFQEELDNAESVLLLFDEVEVNSARAEWRQKIRDGRHRVVQFDSTV